MRRTAVVGLVLAIMCACSSSERTTAPAASPSGGFAHGNVLIDTSEGSVLVKIEIADSEQERELGLMNRTFLAENAGMMFIFMEPVKTGFWMKDTTIPLSIAFINDNFDIVSILDMEPCEAAPCKVYTPESAYSAALEVNQGAFEKWGVRVGDRVTLTRS